jgi:stage II sporulation SpoE-like protein/GAF domain-containing protein
VETDERARLEALRELGLLDTPPEERFDRVVRLAKRLFDVPVVAVDLIDDDRLFTKSAVGFEPGTSTPRDISFCPRTIDTRAPLVIQDAQHDPDWADHPSVTGSPHVRFYAGSPLSSPGGEVVGALCLMDEQPRVMSLTDHALLEDLARWVESELNADADAVQAREIQRRMLPRTPPNISGYDITGVCRPAMHVGGDYYDWVMLDDSLLQVTVADVMGKGLAAGVITAGIRTALRVTSRFNSLTESVRRTAASLQDDFDETATFATMFTARLRTQSGHLEYVDAGHGLAIILPPDGPARHLSSDDLPLGADPDATWVSHIERLEPGATLLIVSDGMLDIFPDPADAISAAEKLAATTATAGEMVDQILALAADAPMADDLTALVIRREAS